MTKDIATLDPKDYILIKGANLHNLKNIDVAIPRNQLVVITGLSGSGKSSLAFDTLFAEGQRRYVESLSSYARQFLGRLHKPQVDSIKGIAPAIAIEQKVNATNPRSTVGTATELYDYLKLLFARIGKTYSPVSGEIVEKHRVKDVVNHIKELEPGTKLHLLAPVHIPDERSVLQTLKILSQQGYSRIKYRGIVHRIETIKEEIDHDFHLVIDRVIIRKEDDFLNRLAEAVETTFFEGKGTCIVEEIAAERQTVFSNRFERDGIRFMEPNTHFFSFNNPYGACPECEGYGNIIGIDRDLVIPNTNLSILDGAILPWRSEVFKKYRNRLINHAYEYDISIHKPWFELTTAQKELVWNGTDSFKGINQFFRYLEEKSYKIQYRVMLSRYRGKTPCPACLGKRLREETAYVKIGAHSINDLVDLPLDELSAFFKALSLEAQEEKIASRLLVEITKRLQFLNDVGLQYLTLNRASNTLSGGESQRINLATSLGSSLVGSMYILDEPSIGLHPRDSERLLKVLKSLRDLGNTVIVVEHDETIIKAADKIIDIGPEAGTGGGTIVAEG
ncbi:MAG: excinuclease ABC subunit A, partial [Lutibacter sp.]|nr:excinuclease ABC subunit A [Lutibacter sp.]